jgi:hypothetical protein
MARFSDQMVGEVVQRFWAAMARGEVHYRRGGRGRYVPQEGSSVAGCGGRGQTASRAGSKGPVLVVLRA